MANYLELLENAEELPKCYILPLDKPTGFKFPYRTRTQKEEDTSKAEASSE